MSPAYLFSPPRRPFQCNDVPLPGSCSAALLPAVGDHPQAQGPPSDSGDREPRGPVEGSRGRYSGLCIVRHSDYASCG